MWRTISAESSKKIRLGVKIRFETDLCQGYADFAPTFPNDRSLPLREAEIPCEPGLRSN